ncbi:MAG: hypothetical protein HY836_02480 [Aquabacterium sp.]|uniref:hypothetical protein n=1 Tax=Aquabacterium sp. TaxID=1872578 RepID=UPI0025C200A2|nr:hypothetical protein [Aquabacterium sp.]MBI5924443.1 hypothetical protein [Aquabacterium sp.]
MNEETEFVRLHGPIKLASAETECWKCHAVTPVHALVATDVEEFVDGEEPFKLEATTFVYDLSPDAIPAEVTAVVAQTATNFKPTFSRMAGETSWGNVCIHCGVLQGAFFLHSEPDGPFFGGPNAFSGALTLVSSVGFDVDGASYSL